LPADMFAFVSYTSQVTGLQILWVDSSLAETQAVTCSLLIARVFSQISCLAEI